MHFWNHRPRFPYSLCNFYWATTTIKGRLLSSVTNAKARLPKFLVRDFVTLTFDLEQLSFVACHVTNLATKYEDPTPIRCWVTSYNVSHWLHWKCVRGHCAFAESRDPSVGGEKRLHFWNPRPRFGSSLYNFGGSTMNIIKVICENNARPVLKAVDEFVRMREITRSVKVAL